MEWAACAFKGRELALKGGDLEGGPFVPGQSMDAVRKVNQVNAWTLSRVFTARDQKEGSDCAIAWKKNRQDSPVRNR
jgi:hypothetical protein